MEGRKKERKGETSKERNEIQKDTETGGKKEEKEKRDK